MGSDFNVSSLFDPLDFSGTQAGKRRRNALDAINTPLDPKFNLTDENGKLKANLRQEGRDFFGRDQLRSIADFDTDSPIAQRLLQQQKFQGQNQRNLLNARNQSNLRNSISTLSSRGGIDAGTRARLTAQAQRANILGTQQLAGNQLAQQNKIRTDDANRSFSTLQNLASLDRADQRADLSTVLKESELQRQLEGARLNASAQIQNSKGGPTFICTALYKRGLISSQDFKRIYKVAVKGILYRPDAMLWYFNNMGPVVKQVEAMGDDVDWKLIKNNTITKPLLIAHQGHPDIAAEAYLKSCQELCELTGNEFPPELRQPQKILSRVVSIIKLLSHKGIRPVIKSAIFKFNKPTIKRRLKCLLQR